MIIILEQDTGKDDGSKFLWKPFFFRGHWRDKVCWRTGWGFWCIAYYPEKRLKTYTEYIREGNTEWHYESTYKR